MSPSPKGLALITGASSGFGAIYADRLARRGHDLVLVARDAARLEALADRLRGETGRQVRVEQADLTAAADLKRITALFASDESLSLLVNNAGMALTGTLTTSPDDEISRLLLLNVTATTMLAKAAAQAFRQRQAGAIINISSVLALMPEMFDVTYSATKAFLMNLSQGLAAELAPSGVQVQLVMPGAARTEIWERSGKDVGAFPPDMVMDAEDLVDAALLGFDRGETVTIPALEDEGLWLALQQARGALGPHLSRRNLATRYSEALPA